jgi:hypothetical protein
MRPALLLLAATLTLSAQTPSAGITLHGTVRDGGHIAQAYVYAIPLRDRLTPPPSAISRPDGTYTLTGLPPGDFRIVASVYPEDIPYRDPEALKPWLLRGRPLTIVPGTTPTLDLQVEPYD